MAYCLLALFICYIYYIYYVAVRACLIGLVMCFLGSVSCSAYAPGVDCSCVYLFNKTSVHRKKQTTLFFNHFVEVEFAQRILTHFNHDCCLFTGTDEYKLHCIHINGTYETKFYAKRIQPTRPIVKLCD